MNRTNQRNVSKSDLIKRVKYLENLIAHIDQAIKVAGLTVIKGPNGLILEKPITEVANETAQANPV